MAETLNEYLLSQQGKSSLVPGDVPINVEANEVIEDVYGNVGKVPPTDNQGNSTIHGNQNEFSPGQGGVDYNANEGDFVYPSASKGDDGKTYAKRKENREQKLRILQKRLERIMAKKGNIIPTPDNESDVYAHNAEINTVKRNIKKIEIEDMHDREQILSSAKEKEMGDIATESEDMFSKLVARWGGTPQNIKKRKTYQDEGKVTEDIDTTKTNNPLLDLIFTNELDPVLGPVIDKSPEFINYLDSMWNKMDSVQRLNFMNYKDSLQIEEEREGGQIKNKDNDYSRDISPSSSFRKEYHPGGEPGHKHGFQKARETLNIKPKRWMFTKDEDYKTAIDAWTAKNIKVKDGESIDLRKKGEGRFKTAKPIQNEGESNEAYRKRVKDWRDKRSTFFRERADIRAQEIQTQTQQANIHPALANLDPNASEEEKKQAMKDWVQGKYLDILSGKTEGNIMGKEALGDYESLAAQYLEDQKAETLDVPNFYEGVGTRTERTRAQNLAGFDASKGRTMSDLELTASSEKDRIRSTGKGAGAIDARLSNLYANLMKAKTKTGITHDLAKYQFADKLADTQFKVDTLEKEGERYAHDYTQANIDSYYTAKREDLADVTKNKLMLSKVMNENLRNAILGDAYKGILPTFERGGGVIKRQKVKHGGFIKPNASDMSMSNPFNKFLKEYRG